MAPNNVVDLIRDQVLGQLRSEAGRQIAEVIEQTRDEARRQLSELIANAPLSVDVDPKADAKDRASRTMLQGAVATILVAGILAVANGLGDDGFDFTSGGDWKAIAGAALAAMIMAGGAFVQRLVNPPKV